MDLLLHTQCIGSATPREFYETYQNRYLTAFAQTSPQIKKIQERFKHRYRDAIETLTTPLSVDPDFPTSSWTPPRTFAKIFSIDADITPCNDVTLENVTVPPLQSGLDLNLSPAIANTAYLPHHDAFVRSFDALLKCDKTEPLNPNRISAEQYLQYLKKNIKLLGDELAVRRHTLQQQISTLDPDLRQTYRQEVRDINTVSERSIMAYNFRNITDMLRFARNISMGRLEHDADEDEEDGEENGEEDEDNEGEV